MTISSLITALAIGTAVGLGGRLIVPARRIVPFWVPLAVAISAAMLATVVVRLAGIDTSGVTAVEVIAQVIFAGTGVGIVAATADPRFDGASRSRCQSFRALPLRPSLRSGLVTTAPPTTCGRSATTPSSPR